MSDSLYDLACLYFEPQKDGTWKDKDTGEVISITNELKEKIADSPKSALTTDSHARLQN